MTYRRNKNIKELTDDDIGKFVFYVPFEYCGESAIKRGKIKSYNNENKTAFIVTQCAGEWDNYMDYTACRTDYNNLFFSIESPEITFVQAVVVYQNGGTIKSVSKDFGCESIFDNSNLNQNLVDQYGNAITPKDILDGKWYIIKENEPCRL